MEPRTEQLVAVFVHTNDHLVRIPGVDSQTAFECAVCSSTGRFSVRYRDTLQESIIRLGRDCDRYVRRLIQAGKAAELDKKLSKQISEVLAS